MVTKIFLDEEFEHPEWAGHKAPTDPLGLALTAVKSVDSFIVKFSFERNGVQNSGNGFLLNIAGIAGASHNLVLTAAHNLVGPDGSPSTDMVVWVQGEKLSIRQDAYRISSAFTKQQTDATDFGAVLLPRGHSLSTGGFGFDLTLGDMEHFKRKVFITGYRAGADVVSGTVTSESDGNCISYPDQLEYYAQTEKGISGSPVWIGFEGRPTVVAIHNHGAVGRGGSSGSRLTSALFREALSWVNAYESGVRVRAFTSGKGEPTKFPDPKGLYLHFPPTFTFGRVKLGNGTIFDIVPARAKHLLPIVDQSQSGTGNTFKSSDYNFLHEYAFATKHPGSGIYSWVEFNPAKGEVVLANTLDEQCLFRKGGSATQLEKKVPIVRVLVEGYGKNIVQLKMSNEGIREFDGEYAESSEVSFADSPKGDKELWTRFTFEPAGTSDSEK